MLVGVLDVHPCFVSIIHDFPGVVDGALVELASNPQMFAAGSPDVTIGLVLSR